MKFHGQLLKVGGKNHGFLMFLDFPCFVSPTSIPFFHLFPKVIAMGFTILVIRYLDAGQLLMSSSSRRCPRRERLLLAVRTYLRKQWLHFASLTMCSILILVDTIAEARNWCWNWCYHAVFLLGKKVVDGRSW